MRAMWLPKPLYELLPYLYVLIGFGVAYAAAVLAQRIWGSTVIFFLGLAIMAGGVAIWMKRRSTRLDKRSRDTRQLELFDRSRTSQ
jgi:uncharacterized membrane protein